jgi:hypothetical protein
VLVGSGVRIQISSGPHGPFSIEGKDREEDSRSSWFRVAGR